MQILVNGFGSTPEEKAQIWLADGMVRRRIPASWYNNGTGPISNQQTHSTSFLGNLAWGGKVFTSAGDPDVWGVDIASLRNTSTISDQQVIEVAHAVYQEIEPNLEKAAFEGAQRAEKE